MNTKFLFSAVGICAGSYIIFELAGMDEKSAPLVIRTSSDRVNSVATGEFDQNDQFSFVRENSDLTPDILKLAALDLGDALKYIDKHNEQVTARNVRRSLALHLIKADIKLVERCAEMCDFPADCHEIVQKGILYWISKNRSLVISYCNAMEPSAIRTNAIATAAVAIASQNDFSAVPELIEKLPFGSIRTQTLSRIVSNYSGDMASLSAWVEKLPLDEDRKALELPLFNAIQSSGNLDAMMRFAAFSRNPEYQANAYKLIGADLAGVTPDSFIQLVADGQISEKNRLSALVGGLAKLPSSRSMLLADALKVFPSPESANAVYSVFVQRAFLDSPKAAISFLDKVPRTSIPSAAKALAQKWYSTDSEGLSNWVNELPKSEMRDHVLSQISFMLWDTDKDLAKSVAAKIESQVIRKQLAPFVK